MNLESPKVTTQKSQQEMFNFLTTVENYEQVMPSSLEKFEVTGNDSFLFSLKGMPQIELQIKETREPELIVLGSTSDKFDFAIDLVIEPAGETQSDVQLLFNGKFNAMMAMMVKGPLNKFITTLSENIQKV
ncbi:SRPBCC family protein [Antarcticibacterium arcticum]|uniref:SRPBCC family protein n=1 Tax=Antarcticibacterium arcticum TaxID=2585771 RepID=A0A5B8YHK9_9FLAO|nr:SRPBCC family protein [Antarcticibacterium arcticum]QED36297.1 SRPBCC family protein [Antarcticibacterium arcticum]